MRISDWSSDVCSSDLQMKSSSFQEIRDLHLTPARFRSSGRLFLRSARYWLELLVLLQLSVSGLSAVGSRTMESGRSASHPLKTNGYFKPAARSLLALCTCPLEPVTAAIDNVRSEEHTSELQSLMRISYAAFFLTH